MGAEPPERQGVAPPLSTGRQGVARGRCGLLALTAALIAGAASGPPRPGTVAWTERVEVASGGARQGPWRMNASRFHYVDDPTVVIDDAGVVGVAWADQWRKDLFFQLFSPGGRSLLEKPANVSRSAEVFSWLPRMVVAPGDPSRIFVLWQEIVFSGGSHGGEIFFARSTDGGRRFDRPVNLSRSAAGDGKGRLTRRLWHNGSLDLARGPEGTLYAAWTEYEGSLWLSRSTDEGQAFSRPLRIAGEDDAGPARGPSLAAAAAGTVFVAWTVGEDAGAHIHLSESRDGGRSFDAPRIAFESDGHADAPKLVVDGAGVVHLVCAVSPAGPSGRYRILYARSRDDARSFDRPREISSPLPAGFESAGFPALGVDGEDNPHVLWELFPDRAGRPRGLGFTLSADRGGTFATPSVIPGTDDAAIGHNGGRQGLLMKKLAVNRAGAVAVVNSTFLEGEKSHVWLYRGRRARHDAPLPAP